MFILKLYFPFSFFFLCLFQDEVQELSELLSTSKNKLKSLTVPLHLLESITGGKAGGMTG